MLPLPTTYTSLSHTITELQSLNLCPNPFCQKPVSLKVLIGEIKFCDDRTNCEKKLGMFGNELKGKTETPAVNIKPFQKKTEVKRISKTIVKNETDEVPKTKLKPQKKLPRRARLRSPKKETDPSTISSKKSLSKFVKSETANVEKLVGKKIETVKGEAPRGAQRRSDDDSLNVSVVVAF
ncbi:hypothetical protein TL16_g09562 [Triparma laevis f. inornata]|uniref:Uncharacterized protein n=2 Tax=Triparma laevis TaxID=1534972 RepID=A0A9W7DVL8_9STRA|nr:hypothetical protein TrLO_g14356 [Triparma laevis f. longispina]GMH83334.1 hypothetical protein TL16_g09562 [Triparma laevis f. inornata]